MKPEAFIQYIQDWVDGKPIKSKTPGFTMIVGKESVKDFAKDILSKPFLKNFVLFTYSEETWKKVEAILLKAKSGQ